MQTRRELRDLLRTANRARYLADESMVAGWRDAQERRLLTTEPNLDPDHLAERDAALRAILGRA